MRNILRSILFMSLAVVLLGSCVSNKKYDALVSEKNQLEQDLASAKKNAEMLAADKTKLESEKMTLSKKVDAVEDELSDAKQMAMKAERIAKDSEAKYDQLRSDIKGAFASIDNSGFSVEEKDDKFYVLTDGIQYRTASTSLNNDDVKVLETIAGLLTKNPNLQLVIEGHTDDVPISNARYSDNWDLSVARSTRVIRKLVKLGVNPSQLTAAGKGEFGATQSGTSAEARKANRRTEFILVPQVGKLYKIAKGKA